MSVFTEKECTMWNSAQWHVSKYAVCCYLPLPKSHLVQTLHNQFVLRDSAPLMALLWPQHRHKPTDAQIIPLHIRHSNKMNFICEIWGTHIPENWNLKLYERLVLHYTDTYTHTHTHTHTHTYIYIYKTNLSLYRPRQTLADPKAWGAQTL
jgi:hypothetical protein